MTNLKVKYFLNEYIQIFIKNRWEQYELDIIEYNSKTDLGQELVEKYGIILADRVYLCKKQ